MARSRTRRRWALHNSCRRPMTPASSTISRAWRSRDCSLQTAQAPRCPDCWSWHGNGCFNRPQAKPARCCWSRARICRSPQTPTRAPWAAACARRICRCSSSPCRVWTTRTPLPCAFWPAPAAGRSPRCLPGKRPPRCGPVCTTGASPAFRWGKPPCRNRSRNGASCTACSCFRLCC
ncbi:hypothetical protein GALL_521000 [mine drainage metagenome]|uniref:Uncharacterized protein n=1 Tax=mine drainage metagenome TaxID=410659 RepID=A0A1J5PLZ9_9ZZZZ